MKKLVDRSETRCYIYSMINGNHNNGAKTMTKDLNKISDNGWFIKRTDIGVTGIYHQLRLEDPNNEMSWRKGRPATAKTSGRWSRPE